MNFYDSSLLVTLLKRIYFSIFELFFLIVSQYDTLKHVFLCYVSTDYKSSLLLLVGIDKALASESLLHLMYFNLYVYYPLWFKGTT